MNERPSKIVEIRERNIGTKWRYSYHHIVMIHEIDTEEYFLQVWKCFLYDPDEQFEIDVYGDQSSDYDDANY